MSRVLSCFPESPGQTRSSSKYDWDLWFDGRIHALSPEEYGFNIYAFRNSALRAGKRRGIRIRTTQLGKEIVIQARRSVWRAK